EDLSESNLLRKLCTGLVASNKRDVIEKLHDKIDPDQADLHQIIQISIEELSNRSEYIDYFKVEQSILEEGFKEADHQHQIAFGNKSLHPSRVLDSLEKLYNQSTDERMSWEQRKE